MKAVADTTVNLLVYLSTFFIAAAALLTCTDIVLRNFFGMSIFGLIDLMQFSIMYSVFFAIAYGFAKRAHVAVTVLTDHLSRRTSQFLASLWWLLSVLLMALLTYGAFEQALIVHGYHDVSQNIEIPMVAYWFPIVIGLGLSALASAWAILIEYNIVSEA
jgi:TRAP-type C4-dicarboxylate transport system permease small subunit